MPVVVATVWYNTQLNEIKWFIYYLGKNDALNLLDCNQTTQIWMSVSDVENEAFLSVRRVKLMHCYITQQKFGLTQFKKSTKFLTSHLIRFVKGVVISCQNFSSDSNVMQGRVYVHTYHITLNRFSSWGTHFPSFL